MDVRAARAREHHQAALRADGDAARHRAARDAGIMRLRREDPAAWTYGALAGALGCSVELVAQIVRRNGQ